MTAAAIRSAGILPDLRIEHRAAIRRELATAERLEVDAAAWREHANWLSSRTRPRAPRALSVELLPTAQRLRLNGAARWMPKVPATVKVARPAPVVDPVAKYMAQPDLHDVPVWSRLRERVGDVVLALVARVVVPRRMTTTTAARETSRRKELLAPLAVRSADEAVVTS